VIPIIQAIRPREDLLPFCHALWACAAERIAPELWGLAEAQPQFVKLVSGACHAGWIARGDPLYQWVLATTPKSSGRGHATGACLR
jgi:hypothetical protein